MKNLFRFYFESFKGLRKEIWLLSLITLINRAGTMVIPFLSLYLTKSRGFTLEEVGWILTFFGLGSVTGSWLGGKLTDKIGHYKTMSISLIVSSVLFVLLQFPESFWPICIGIYLVMTVADIFRPAVFVAISAYSKPENRTRSVTLIRLAINLGFSAGPAIGGFIIATGGYNWLFWVDGLTCLAAGLLLLKLLHPKRSIPEPEDIISQAKSAFSDKLYLIFIFAMVIFGFVFIQYFSTMPLYYAEAHKLNEFEIGLLLGLNGLFIFLFEMPLIKFMENQRHTAMGYVILGTVLTGISFLAINLTGWTGILIVGMLLVTIGEMISFPFSNSFALHRSDGKKRGSYMALYSIAFSVSHIFGHNSGMQLIDNFGFEFTWYTMFGLSIFACILLFILKKLLSREKV
ncbi:putative MFS family arabinose efflux permease [Christiangramia gaetbulicola]|uniref:Putative MFS family arabinose efflux permease n=1 Tax=Christiangramia gaetbulicola TaxID=703340 RepID=A0A2T6AJZ7_9FLAO|nr:MFS transporter [Christiangramia gaetbulicola]PTX44145.1 putative MFS family arabinose efflux permease [Christiangramia gaetbulicola]